MRKSCVKILDKWQASCVQRWHLHTLARSHSQPDVHKLPVVRALYPTNPTTSSTIKSWFLSPLLLGFSTVSTALTTSTTTFYINS